MQPFLTTFYVIRGQTLYSYLNYRFAGASCILKKLNVTFCQRREIPSNQSNPKTQNNPSSRTQHVLPAKSTR